MWDTAGGGISFVSLGDILEVAFFALSSKGVRATATRPLSTTSIRRQ